MTQEVTASRPVAGGGGNLVFSRFTGPGRVGLRRYFQPAVQGTGGNAQRDTGGGVLGGIVGGLLDK
jgi:hypothetical protein